MAELLSVCSPSGVNYGGQFSGKKEIFFFCCSQTPLKQSLRTKTPAYSTLTFAHLHCGKGFSMKNMKFISYFPN